MAAETPQEIVKRLAMTWTNTINVKVWIDSLANKVMREGVTAKFTQNLQFLINTGDKKN